MIMNAIMMVSDRITMIIVLGDNDNDGSQWPMTVHEGGHWLMLVMIDDRELQGYCWLLIVHEGLHWLVMIHGGC